MLGVLRLKPDSLMHMGPPCTSFVWVNKATHKRSATSPYGDESKAYVSIGSLPLDFIWYHFQWPGTNIFLKLLKLAMTILA